MSFKALSLNVMFQQSKWALKTHEKQKYLIEEIWYLLFKAVFA